MSRSLTVLGWRVSLQRVQQQPEPCPQCGGYGMWRPPYSSERVPCDLCTPYRDGRARSSSSDSSPRRNHSSSHRSSTSGVAQAGNRCHSLLASCKAGFHRAFFTKCSFAQFTSCLLALLVIKRWMPLYAAA